MTLYAGAGGTSSGGTNVTGGAAGSFVFRGATGGAGTGTGNGGAASDFGVYLGAGSNDFDGVISVSAASSASHTFSTAYASTPVCVLTPTSNPGSLTWWVTASTTAVTANLSAAGTITFNYHCAGNPN
ncbi:MAG: hypothetical protein DMG24_08950 [Acidobacteria bacterium]|nr:MAG: hypothetical protein DMG24_08950 [Acidobacteriota bacterium]